jgi:uncharacterized protein
MIDSPSQRAFGQAKLNELPRPCLDCEVLAMCNGGCPKDRFPQTAGGEERLNYLCAGYKRFFTHCSPFIVELSNLWLQRQSEGQGTSDPKLAEPMTVKVGRNDPCPCGSGQKYKKCCLGK